MNNAGIGRHRDSWSEYQAWQATLNTNLWGVINGIHAFTPAMIAQDSPALSRWHADFKDDFERFTLE